MAEVCSADRVLLFSVGLVITATNVWNAGKVSVRSSVAVGVASSVANDVTLRMTSE